MTITIKCSVCGAELEAAEANAMFKDYSAEATVQLDPCENCMAESKVEGFNEGKEEGLEEGRAEGSEE